MGLVKEFREFALRGNVIDLAVGVIIGGAFGTIVAALVRDVIMPVVGIAGKADFSNLYVGLTSATNDKIRAATRVVDGQAVPPSLETAREMGPVLAYGNFLTVCLNFAILALCVFLMVKAINRLRRRDAAAPPATPPAPTRDQVLLEEIRDLLRARV
ncbi:MAG TPA: large conductance mechanosensitive channel protein MscL [Phycisphaerales bacterium]|nr:large conductance mechanosensitive channel protein MscL [Phycisphaerales bacterium]